MKAIYFLIRMMIKAAFTVNPDVANRLAFDLFTRPLFQIRKKEEIEKLTEADHTILGFEGEKIKVYTFGNGSIPVLLIHGWRGHAGNFSSIVDSFDHSVYKVIAFDAPAHNGSSGFRTNAFQIARLVSKLIETHSPKYIISHSMGSAIAVIAMSELETYPVEKLVLLSTPNSLEYLVDNFSNKLWLSESQIIRFSQHVQNKLERTFEESKIDGLISRIKIPVFIIHDKYDRILPFKSAAKVAVACTGKMRFYLPGNVGHYKMLSNPSVIERIKSFINEEI